MRLPVSLVGAIAAGALVMVGPAAFAQGRGHGANGKPPKPGPSVHAAAPVHPSTPAHATRAASPKAKPVVLMPNGPKAAAGFRNHGQFVAAMHVSRNLGIPFEALKAQMTGPHPLSLGQAIQRLRPGVNVDREIRRAEAAARADRIRR